MLITIYWSCPPIIKDEIIKRFGIPRYTTINGETPAEVTEETLQALRLSEQKGNIQIRTGKPDLFKQYKTLTKI